MNNHPRDSGVYTPSMTWASAAEELRKLASQFAIERRKEDESKFLFRIVAVQKKRDTKLVIPMHINFNMLTNQQEETQAILSVFEQLEAMTLKCDRLEYERDLWKAEAERWRKISMRK